MAQPGPDLPPLDPAARRALDGYLAVLAGAGFRALTAGRLAWPLALTAATASATRLTLAGRVLRPRSPASGVALH